MAGGVLNLDAVTRQSVVIQKTVDDELREWELWDDIPTDVVLQVFQLEALRMNTPRQPEAETQTAEAVTAFVQTMREWNANLEAETLRIFGLMFRNSYDGISDRELATLFKYRHQRTVVMHFFNRAFAGLSEQSAGTDASSPSTTGSPEPTQTATPEPNRAARRARAKA